MGLTLLEREWELRQAEQDEEHETWEPEPSEPTRWQECWDLFQAGMTYDQIAARLSLHRHTVAQHLQVARTYAVRALREDAGWEGLRRELVAGYPDAARRGWIERRLAEMRDRWERRRCSTKAIEQVKHGP